jgi:hypothetical protein
MPTDGTYYLMFEEPINEMLNEPITYNINNYTVTINWKKHARFNYYYHEEMLYSNEAIRQHTIKLIQRLEEIYNKKIHYRLSKKVVLEKADPDSIGFIY